MYSSEKQLVKDCLKGKADAQRELYERYSGKMYGVCLRYAKNEPLAQDILQDGFIRVFRKLELYRGEGSLEGWIRRVIVNVAIRACQKQARMYVVEDLEQAAEESVQETIEGQIAVDDMLGMIRSLPEGYRLVFNLYAIEGYSHKEVGKKLGISEGTSKSQLARARKTLQRMVKAHQEQGKKIIKNETAVG